MESNVSCHIHPQLTPDISSRRVINTNGFPSELGPPGRHMVRAALHPELRDSRGEGSRCRGRYRDQHLCPTLETIRLCVCGSFSSEIRHIHPSAPGAEQAGAARLPPSTR